MRVIVGLLLMVMATAAGAKPEYWEVYRRTFDIAEGSPAATKSCQTCHDGAPPRRNDYGRRVGAALRAANSEILTAALLQPLGPEDAPPPPWATADKAATVAEPPIPVPQHGFHPLVVHFPLALFLVGGLLDLYGWHRRNDALRSAGGLNLILGALSGLVAIPTGFIAFWRHGYSWDGPALFHLASGILAVVLMLGVIWLRKQAFERPAYAFGLLLAITVLVLTGHFGGELVHGAE
jgi:uncharacterized membrane protein